MVAALNKMEERELVEHVEATYKLSSFVDTVVCKCVVE